MKDSGSRAPRSQAPGFSSSQRKDQDLRGSHGQDSGFRPPHRQDQESRIPQGQAPGSRPPHRQDQESRIPQGHTPSSRTPPRQDQEFRIPQGHAPGSSTPPRQNSEFRTPPRNVSGSWSHQRNDGRSRSKSRAQEGKHTHDPSRYRAIIRESKKGTNGPSISTLLREARKLGDPYYTSLALVTLSSDGRLNLDTATTTAEQGINFANRENRTWRKVELLLELHRKLSTWRIDTDGFLSSGEGTRQSNGIRQHDITGVGTGTTPRGIDDVRGFLLGNVMSQIERIPAGQPRTDAIQGLSSRVNASNVDHILRFALLDKGTRLENGRAVIRAWAKKMRDARSQEGGAGSQEGRAGSGGNDSIESSFIEIVGIMNSLTDLENRTRLFGYLHHQIGKNRLTIDAKSPLDHALETSDSITDPADRIEELRYLSTITSDLDGLMAIRDRIRAIGETPHIVRGYASLAGRADKCGSQKLAIELLTAGRALLPGIEDALERTSARLNIARGFHLCGEVTPATEMFQEEFGELTSFAGDEDRVKAGSRTIAAMRKLGYQDDDPIIAEISALVGKIMPAEVDVTPEKVEAEGSREPGHSDSPPDASPSDLHTDPPLDPPSDLPHTDPSLDLHSDSPSDLHTDPPLDLHSDSPSDLHEDTPSDLHTDSPFDPPSESPSTPPSDPPEATPEIPSSEEDHSGNHVLALYDAYEGGLKPTHYRTLARAAPLCFAYDLDLALVGFPEDNLDRIVQDTITETNIGRGGKLLGVLHSEGRIHSIPATTKIPPESWIGLGTPIGTTSHPDPKKRVVLMDGGVIPDQRTGRSHFGGRLCIIMGLGRQGLPPSLLRSVDYHLELTGKNVPLETATAMGIIAERLNSFSADR
jgi:uncharacterized protein